MCFHLTILSIIIIYAWCSEGQVSKSVSVVFQSTSSSVCITNSSYAMIWNDREWDNSKIESIYPNSDDALSCPLGEHFSCTRDWKLQTWSIADSIQDNIGEAIFDRRWEELDIRRTNFVKHNQQLRYSDVVELNSTDRFRIPFSIRMKSNAHIFLCTGHYPPESECYWIILDGWGDNGSPLATALRKCTSDIPRQNNVYPSGQCSERRAEYEGKALLDEHHWRHFVIEKDRNQLKLNKISVNRFEGNEEHRTVLEEEILQYNDHYEPLEGIRYVIIHGKNNPGLWKFHKYDYIKTTQSQPLLPIRGPFSVYGGFVCISFFMRICRTCTLFFRIEDSVTETKITEHLFATPEEKWEEKKIVFRYINENPLQMYVNADKRSHFDSGFWALDSIQSCSEDGFRTLSITNRLHKSKECQILEYDFSVPEFPGSLKEEVVPCSLDTFSNFCLPCRIFGNNYCEGGKVWEFTNENKNKYSCTSGYIGDDCTQRCPFGTYGFQCTKKCGFCIGGACDHKSGSCYPNGCQHDYTGSRCDTPLGVIWNAPPTVLDVFYTTCSLQIQISDGYSGTEEPDHYYFQVRQKSSSNWENTSDPADISYIRAVTVEKLKPDTEYEARVVVYKLGGIVNVGNTLKISSFKTLCKEIEPDDLSVESTNTTAVIKIKNDNSDMSCPLSKYRFTIDNSRQAKEFHADSLIFESLEPYKDYQLVFTNKEGTNRELKMKPFKTQEGVPGKVRSLKIGKSTSTSVHITWQEPSSKNGIVRYYIIKYKLLRHRACKENISETDLKTSREKQSTATLRDLEPYAVYKIEVSAVTVLEGASKEIRGETQETSNLSKEEEPSISRTEAAERSVTVYLELTENCQKINGPIFIRGKLSCQEEWCEDKAFSTLYGTASKRPFTISDLIPYSNYTVQLSACRQNNSNICGRVLSQNIETKPSAPNEVRDLLVYSKNESSISLRWRPPYPPYGILSGYTVKYYYNHNWYGKYENEQTVAFDSHCDLWPEFNCITITREIYSGYEYTIQVSAINEPNLVGKKTEKNYVYAEEEAPESPYDLSITWLENDTMSLVWKHPNVTNGNLIRFYIAVNYENSKHNILSVENEAYSLMTYKPKYSYQVSYPHPSTLYMVYIYAVNRAGRSSEAMKADTSPPPKPVLDRNPSMIDMTNTSIIITLPKLHKSIRIYGFKLHYCLLINDTQTEIKNQYHNRFMEEQMRNSFQHYQMYRIMYCEDNKFGYGDTNFVIGGNSSKISSDQYENPPLKPGRYYTIIVYMLTEFKGKTRYNIYKVRSNTGGDPNVSVFENRRSKNSALYALLLLLIVPLILGLVLYWKIKNKGVPCFGISIRRSESAVDDFTMRDSVPLTTKPVTKVAVVPPIIEKRALAKEVKNNEDETITVSKGNVHSKPIEVIHFEDYVKSAMQNGELEKQHALFPRGQTMPWDYGAMKVNKPKNRYNNLIAYDHTRVKLTKIEGDDYSDYINANYIDGYKMPKAYIATQGPKASTLNDFWRMIWQENVKNIIMLANVYEGGKKKVEQYWPNINEELHFGDITVQYVSTDIFANYEYRTFSVTHKGQSRKVEQLHFTSWPDHGVPLYSQSLVPFLQKILKIPIVRNSPIVVHCSAGVGRTGTIILCDMSLRMAAREGIVDMLRILQKIRSQRPNMVDNYEQYKLAHLVVLECLIGLQTAIPCNDDMEMSVKKLIENNGVQTQMKYLRDTEWQDQAMTTIASSSGQRCLYPEKNRDANIVPESHSYIFIPRYPVDDESSSYINAVEVDGFRAPARFLVTQNPLPNTLGDFWRLIMEKEITIIISLNEINENDKNCCKIWPDKSLPEILPVDFIVLKHSKTTSLDCYDIHNVHLVNKSKNHTTLVQIIAMKNWLPKSPLPPSEEEFLTFWEESNAHSRGSSQVIVTCYDGAKASGIYVAMSFIIEKMKLEQECDVCQAVRNVRHNRRQFIESEEQYKFLFDASLKYINGFQSYANFN